MPQLICGMLFYCVHCLIYVHIREMYISSKKLIFCCKILHFQHKCANLEENLCKENILAVVWFLSYSVPAVLAGNIILLMCYCSIAGWMVRYFVDTAAGKFAGLNVEQIGAMFPAMTRITPAMAFYTVATVALATFACSFSLQGGLERSTKWMMLALLSIMILLAINSCCLEGAAEGLAFYLKPDLKKFNEAGIWNVVVAAMNQSFFSLSLGIGSMAIFGSYLQKEHTLLGEAVNVIFLDTFVAFTAGLIIFSACSASDCCGDTGHWPGQFLWCINTTAHRNSGRQ